MTPTPAEKKPLTKKSIVEHIQSHLLEQLQVILASARAAHEEATHEESGAENQYDTRGLEASYLAEAQAQRAQEIQGLLTLYRFLPLREFTSEDVICPTSLVELDHEGTRAHYFIVPKGGGLIAQIDGYPVQIITAYSPLGEALLGRKQGDLIEVELRGQTREYEVITVR